MGVPKTADSARAIFAAAPVGLCRVDADGLVVEANARWCELVARDPSEITGTSWLDSVHVEHRSTLAAEHAAFIAGDIERMQFTCRFGVGDEVAWVCLEASQPGGAESIGEGQVLSASDITWLKSAEIELATARDRALEAETLLAEAIDAMSEGFVYYDADDRIVLFNTRHRELFPSHAEVMRPGLTFQEMLRAQVKGIKLKVAQGREEEWIAERIAQHRNPGGPIEQHWADGRIIRLSEYKTRSGGIVAIRADITDLKRAEGEVKALNEQLEQRVEERTRELEATQRELVQRERLAALGQLIGSVSHELRGPLGTISASVSGLTEAVGGESALAVRAAARIERAARRCNSIVSELLDFVRPSVLSAQSTAVDEWLVTIIDELVAPDGVEIVRRLGAPDAYASIDRERLRQAVVNLYDNACQAVAGGGRVTFETAPRDDHVAISVVDDGPGIAHEDLGAIFEPMFTTKASGVGLGLSIVKRVVDLHDAQILVDSTPGAGARFTIVTRSERA